MGEQQMEPTAGLRVEAQSDSTANQVQPVGLCGHQDVPIEEQLCWIRVSKDNPLNKALDDLEQTLGFMVQGQVKVMTKQINELKRFSNA